ncbi:MAG: pilus assembly PilX N-terminal domain-containing protein [Acidobacteria bacterium]|nr:pilus assembly PilX N-terminal domain-containing protein [Acidobacteriota bacterium]
MPLVTVMMALALLTGLGTVLVVGTMTETAVVASYRQGIEAFYAAEGAVEFAIRDLARAPDWDAVLSGAATSAFVDGPPEGPRQVGRVMVDLEQATADVEALAAAGADGPLSFALYAYGRFADLLPATGAPPPIYLCVWVAEIPDGLRLIGRAYGPTGAQRTIAISLARSTATDDDGLDAIEVLSWEELR